MAGCALRLAVSSHYAQVGCDINALVKPIRVFWPPQALTIPERARVADGDDQLRLQALTQRARPNAFEQQ
jgi:hypothetical protein